MARIYMVRHGQAEAGFGGAMDPGLNALGREQAEAVAQILAPRGPLPILSSRSGVRARPRHRWRRCGMSIR
jgi:broad specificity phosphatase PhoE